MSDRCDHKKIKPYHDGDHICRYECLQCHTLVSRKDWLVLEQDAEIDRLKAENDSLRERLVFAKGKAAKFAKQLTPKGGKAELIERLETAYKNAFEDSDDYGNSNVVEIDLSDLDEAIKALRQQPSQTIEVDGLVVGENWVREKLAQQPRPSGELVDNQHVQILIDSCRNWRRDYVSDDTACDFWDELIKHLEILQALTSKGENDELVESFEKYANSVGYTSFEKYETVEGLAAYKNNQLQRDYKTWKAAIEALQAPQPTGELVEGLRKVSAFLETINLHCADELDYVDTAIQALQAPVVITSDDTTNATSTSEPVDSDPVWCVVDSKGVHQVVPSRDKSAIDAHCKANQFDYLGIYPYTVQPFYRGKA